MFKKICLNYTVCYCAVLCKFLLLFHCPSEAFKLCIICKNIIYLAMVSLSTSFENKMMMILQVQSQKEKLLGPFWQISMKALKDSSFSFSRQQNSCFQFFPLPFYLSISTSSRRKTFKEDEFL